MKILYILPLSFILIAPFHLSSQTFKRGYVITSSNDTLKGYIKENTDDALMKKIFFSADSSATKITEYIPAELKGFGFNNGRVFEKFALKEFDGKTFVEKSVFAKRILVGKVSIYLIQSGSKDNEYILRNEVTGAIVHLEKPKEKEIKREGGTFTARDNKYVEYLSIIKQDASGAPAKQENIRYAKQEIVKNVKKYDETYQHQFPVHQYKEQRQLAFSITGGLPVLQYNDISNRYRFSFYWDKTFIEKTLRLSFMQGISYSHYIQYHNKEALNQVINISPLGVKFQTKPLIVTPYVYIGLGVQIITSPIYEYTIDKTENKVSRRETFPYPSSNLGMGVKIKLNSKWAVLTELSYKMFSEGTFVNAGLSYQFTKNGSKL